MHVPEEKNFVDVLISNNQALWDEFLENEFCRKMAESPDSVINPCFREYCEQDYSSLWAWVRFVALRAVAAADIEDVIPGVDHVAGMQHFAMNWKELVMVNFGTRGYDIDTKTLTDAMHNYIEYMLEETRLAALHEDPVRLRVVMTPCLEGYYRIAKNYAEHPPAEGLNELFDTVWVVPNNTAAFSQHVRDFFKSAKRPKDDDYYIKLFRKATEHEIKVFASFLDVKPGETHTQDNAT